MEEIKKPKLILGSSMNTGFHVEDGKVTLIKNEVRKVYLDATHINTEMNYDEFFDKICNIFYPVRKCCENGDCPKCQSTF